MSVVFRTGESSDVLAAFLCTHGTTAGKIQGISTATKTEQIYRSPFETLA